jgi:hypothetical protein
MTLRAARSLVASISLACFITLAGVFNGAKAAQEITPTVDTLRQILKEHWAQLRSLDEGSQSYRIEKRTAAGPNKPAEVRVAIVTRHGPCAKIESVGAGEQGISARNSQYEFALAKKDAGWALKAFNTTDTAPSNGQSRKVFQRPELISPLSTISDLDGGTFLERENLKFESVEKHKEAHLRIVAREQLYSASGNPGSKRKWILIVDPLNHFCILDCQKYSDEKLIVRSTREIGTENGRLVCRKLTYAVYYPPGDTSRKVTDIETNFHDYRVSEKFTDADYYLSHFGLPEPTATESVGHTFRWSWIIGGVAIALLIAASLLFKFARKGTGSAVPN